MVIEAKLKTTKKVSEEIDNPEKLHKLYWPIVNNYFNTLIFL